MATASHLSSMPLSLSHAKTIVVEAKNNVHCCARNAWSGNSGRNFATIPRRISCCAQESDKDGSVSLRISREAIAATISEEIAASELLERAQIASGLKTEPKGPADKFNSTTDPVSDSVLKKLVWLESVDQVMETLSIDPSSVNRSVLHRIVELSAMAGNTQLSLDIVEAMKAAGYQTQFRRDGATESSRPPSSWTIPAADVDTYVSLVRGLAAALKVKDSTEAIEQLRRRGLPPGDEVPFGKIVDCPTCRKSLAVVQPHQGVQIAACGQCRYQYELMSGDVVKCESESLAMESSILEQGLRLLRLKRDPVKSAVHSMVVRAPDGVARSHRFATATSDIPAQEGERVTIASAAPESARKRKALGLLYASTRVPGWQPGEPMALTNHVTAQVSALLRAPQAEGLGKAGSLLLPAAILFASSDAISGLFDPSLPAVLAITAGTSVAVGSAATTWLLPKLNQLPERTADSVTPRQQLLQQHRKLESRLEQLTQAASQEVRMLARLWQLQNKMEAVGEPQTYTARIERVQAAREGLGERLTAKLELIDSYAKIAAMIEIEVEMDSDLLAAEAASAAESIADQIVRLEEVERLQTEWKQQAEANDEVERLLRSAPPLPESV